MPVDAPQDPPPEAAVEAAVEAPPAVRDAPVAAEPVSPVKEWAAAVVLMIVFAFVCAQFVSFLRNN